MNASVNGRLVRSEEPLNLEMPFETVDRFITPIESFYIRTHFPIPRIAREQWRLKIEGEVEEPLTIGYADLCRLQAQTRAVTLECAGNNRSLLQNKVKGVQWGLGAVGTAEWTGVPLSDVLQRARIKPAACEVILEGADGGPVEDAKAPTGELRFARSIPQAKALDDVLLAYQMNGAELLPEHGFPLRAVVPGWYAVASIKWLQRIIVTDRPFQGYYQTLDYAFWKRRGNVPELVPLTSLQAKAQISRPIEGETLARASRVTIRGAAWSDRHIARVEVSTDDGASWSDAELLGESEPSAWRLWKFQWQAPAEAGERRLLARATDADGHGQPLARDLDRGTYMINHVLPVTVRVA